MKFVVIFDRQVIYFLQRISLPLARLTLFIVFGWFGVLKIINVSPANPLVESLLHRTLPSVSFEIFIVFFGLYEILIGLSFLLPGLERLAIALLIPHLVMTALPLILLPQITWQRFLIPTLEGQYIVKNLVIIALAFNLGAHLRPWPLI